MRVGQGLGDPLHDRVRICQHIIVPKAQYTIASLEQECRPVRICLRLRDMLTAIKLHYKLPVWATKVGNVPADDMLAPELGSTQLSAP